MVWIHRRGIYGSDSIERDYRLVKAHLPPFEEMEVWTELPKCPRTANRKELSLSLRDRWGDGNYRIREYNPFDKPIAAIREKFSNFSKAIKKAEDAVMSFGNAVAPVAAMIAEPKLSLINSNYPAAQSDAIRFKVRADYGAALVQGVPFVPLHPLDDQVDCAEGTKATLNSYDYKGLEERIYGDNAETTE